MRSLWRAIVGASCSLVLLSSLALAQGSTAQINGTVRDASGGVLPGATVVGARYDADELEMAMSAEAYTGLASWLESSPPGRTGQVT